ncbi:hypothetical protein B296_00047318 [Ensete ventricosum]|uniref:Uncharacterized protein n=1 Tax=Ensete ventricosum TaxID=4639 RepID=A0A426Z043_ENSVE|nr:hypothetical protein B296_00047318 [Ensete ventricosum]
MAAGFSLASYPLLSLQLFPSKPSLFTAPCPVRSPSRHPEKWRFLVSPSLSSASVAIPSPKPLVGSLKVRSVLEPTSFGRSWLTLSSLVSGEGGPFEGHQVEGSLEPEQLGSPRLLPARYLCQCS